MGQSKPTLGFPTKRAAILALAAENVHPRQIAAKVGCSWNQVQVILSEQRTEFQRDFTTQLSNKTLRLCNVAAKARGIDNRRLIAKLVAVIASDNMFDAILDDKDD